MDTPPLTVLRITGWCRNGSTIIGNVLGEVPGFCHVGELAFLWRNAAGLGSNNLCGCGAELTQCPLWSQVLQGRPAGTSARAHAEAVIARQQAGLRTRHTWRVLRRGLDAPGAREHADLMYQIYRAIAGRTDARVIVDTTKLPGEEALLAHVAGVTPRYVHLVRDPRAVAQSWSVRKQYAYVMPAWRSTAYWQGFNRAARAITQRYPDRSLLLRYEDFIADPAASVDALVALCGVEPGPNPVRERTVDLRPNHTVTGNPDRFRSGPTLIRPDDGLWRARLASHARVSATALSWPLLRRYGYSYGGTFGARRPGPAPGLEPPAAGLEPLAAGLEPLAAEEH